jgi:hypothetical protein
MTLSLALSLLGSLALGFLVIGVSGGLVLLQFGVAVGSGSIALGGGFGAALP